MVNRILLNAAAIGLLLAAPAVAQSGPGTPHSQSIGGGPEWAFPAEDSDFRGVPGVRVSWRDWLGPHLGISTDFGWWRVNKVERFDSPQFDGRPPQVTGVSRNTLSAYSLGFAVLGRIPAGRAAIILGGGPAWFHDRGQYDQRISYAGAESEHYNGNATRSALGVHTVAEVEVRATNRMSVFGGLRSELRNVRYPESAIAYPTFGVRFGLF